MDKAAMPVLGRGPALVAEVLRGGHHGEWAAAQGREGLRLLEDTRDHGDLVPAVAERPRGRAHGLDHRRVLAQAAGSRRAMTSCRPTRASVGRIARPRRIKAYWVG